MKEIFLVLLIAMILVIGFYLHTIMLHYEKQLPVSVKYPPYTNYDLAKKNITEK